MFLEFFKPSLLLNDWSFVTCFTQIDPRFLAEKGGIDWVKVQFTNKQNIF